MSYHEVPPFKYESLENHGCPGPCEACHPTYEKAIIVTQSKTVYRTTVVYDLNVKHALEQMEKEGEWNYDWEEEDPEGWQLAEACSDPVLTKQHLENLEREKGGKE